MAPHHRPCLMVLWPDFPDSTKPGNIYVWLNITRNLWEHCERWILRRPGDRYNGWVRCWRALAWALAKVWERARTGKSYQTEGSEVDIGKGSGKFPASYKYISKDKQRAVAYIGTVLTSPGTAMCNVLLHKGEAACTSFLSATVIQYPDQKTIWGRKWLTSIHSSKLQSIIVGSQGRNSGSESHHIHNGGQSETSVPICLLAVATYAWLAFLILMQFKPQPWEWWCPQGPGSTYLKRFPNKMCP